MMTKENKLDLTIKPLTTENRDDFVELFGKNGACGGCWCRSFRLKRADFLKLKGEGNKLAMRKLVEQQFTGLLAYEKAGFKIAGQSSKSKFIVRYEF